MRLTTWNKVVLNMGFGTLFVYLWTICLPMSIELNVASRSSSSLILNFRIANELSCLFEFMPIALYSISINHCPDIVFNLSALIRNSPTMSWSVVLFGYVTTIVVVVGKGGHFITTKTNSSSASMSLQWKVEMQSGRMSGYSVGVLALSTSGNISRVLPMDGCFCSV